MKKIIITTLVGASLLLVGCGSSASMQKSAEEVTQTIIEGETVTLSSGDVIKQSDDAKIVIRHVIESEQKEIEVLSGTVTLVKGNYSAE